MRKIRIFLAIIIAILSGVLAAIIVGQKIFHHKTKPVKQKKVVKTQAKPVQHIKIPAGKKLVALSLDDVQILSKLKKGDKVDVIATSNMPDINMGSISRIILKDILVYEIKDTEKEKFSRRNKKTVYLIMEPEEALKLYSAMKSAKISLILSNRNRDKKLTSKEGKNNKSSTDLASTYTPITGPEIVKTPLIVKKDLSQNIPPNMRAITIKVKQEDGMCGFLKPGDHVDVVITCPFSKFASSGGITPGTKGVLTEYRISSRVLLQDVIVVSIDTPLIAQKFERPKISMVTLLVPAKDVPLLSVAADGSKKGLLRLVLRNPEDRTKVAIKRCYLSDLLSEKRIYSQITIIKGTKVYSQPILK